MKHVLITGAYGGMGRAVTHALRDEGYTVFALDRTVEEAEDGIIPIKVDLRSEEEVTAAVEAIRWVT